MVARRRDMVEDVQVLVSLSFRDRRECWSSRRVLLGWVGLGWVNHDIAEWNARDGLADVVAPITKLCLNSAGLTVLVFLLMRGMVLPCLDTSRGVCHILQYHARSKLHTWIVKQEKASRKLVKIHA